MSAKSLRTAVIFVALTVMGGLVGRGEPVRRSVMIVPARHTIMQIAFDMVRLRGVSLVSYRESEAGDTLAAYSWDAPGRRWIKVDAGDYGDGALFGDAHFVVLVGRDTKIMDGILEAEGWSGPVREIPTMDIAPIVNGLNDIYNFNGREWRWLAARYRLQIEDLNYERRKYGRYGRPRSIPERRGDSIPMIPASAPVARATGAEDEIESMEVWSPAIPPHEPAEEKGQVLTVPVPTPAPAVPVQEEQPEDK